MGKTTSFERLIPEITSRGLAVSLIKHSHESIQMDRLGKESYRLREPPNFRKKAAAPLASGDFPAQTVLHPLIQLKGLPHEA
jgi:hypothetical protein